MDTDNPAYQLIAWMNRGGKHGYYWMKFPPNDTGKEPKRTLWFDVGKPSDWPEGSYNLYYGVHPTNKIPQRISKKTNRLLSPQYVRAEIEDIAAVNCLFGEFDAKHFSGGKDEALKYIDALSPIPNVVVDSGGGYHAYWLLISPYLIQNAAQREKIMKLQYRWVDFIKAEPESKDLARVLRVPGSYNLKPEYGTPREVVQLYADYDMAYELDDLIKALPPEPEKPAKAPTQSIPPARNGSAEKNPRQKWLDAALSRVSSGDQGGRGRNDTCFWMGLQLRYDGVSQVDAESVALNFAEQVRKDHNGNEFTDEEARRCIVSAYDPKYKDREPAQYQGVRNHPAIPTGGGTGKPHPNGSNGNGSKSKEENPASTETDDDEGLKTWKLVYVDFQLIRECYENQEAGDADLLAAMYKGRIIYDHAEGSWYIWKKHFWEKDRTGFVYRLIARRLSPQYFHAASIAESDKLNELADNLSKRAAALRNKKRMDNVLFLAARHEELALTGDEWDANPWILGCTNGVIDLKTGQHRPGKPKDYIRAHSPVEWQGLEAKCPRWEQFLEEIFKNPDISSFMRRLFGYGVTGLTVHHLFPILWGEGRNGKGTMLETLGNVLGGDLATSSQADTLMDMNKSGEGPKPFIYNLRGKRLVWASESNEGRRINEGLVKQLTGGDRLNVRTLHGKPVEFFPSHLLLLITNHKPHINADGSAIWKRVYLIPFEYQFIDNPQAPHEFKADPYLIETLKSEQSGILAWLVRGCLEWQQQGLNPPEAILAATQAYRDEEDTTGLFISEKCLVKPDVRVKAGVLYKAYSEWCKESGFTPMTLTAFGKAMKRRYPARESHGWIYEGIGLLSEQPIF